METQTSKWKFNTLKKTGYGHLNKGGLIYQVQNKHLRHFRVFVTLNGWLWRQNTGSSALKRQVVGVQRAPLPVGGGSHVGRRVDCTDGVTGADQEVCQPLGDTGGGVALPLLKAVAAGREDEKNRGNIRTRGRFLIVLFFLNHFLLLWRNSCYLFTPPTPTTPLCGRFSIMPRNGLVISPGGNQPSSSGRALSCSVDELGVKCLIHRWRREGKEGEREVRPNSFTVIAHDTLVNTATAVLEC